MNYRSDSVSTIALSEELDEITTNNHPAPRLVTAVTQRLHTTCSIEHCLQA